MCLSHIKVQSIIHNMSLEFHVNAVINAAKTMKEARGAKLTFPKLITLDVLL